MVVGNANAICADIINRIRDGIILSRNNAVARNQQFDPWNEGEGGAGWIDNEFLAFCKYVERENLTFLDDLDEDFFSDCNTVPACHERMATLNLDILRQIRAFFKYVWPNVAPPAEENGNAE